MNPYQLGVLSAKSKGTPPHKDGADTEGMEVLPATPIELNTFSTVAGSAILMGLDSKGVPQRLPLLCQLA